LRRRQENNREEKSKDTIGEKNISKKDCSKERKRWKKGQKCAKKNRTTGGLKRLRKEKMGKREGQEFWGGYIFRSGGKENIRKKKKEMRIKSLTKLATRVWNGKGSRTEIERQSPEEKKTIGA